MRFTIGGQEYKVEWRYHNDKEAVEEGVCRGVVHCDIIDPQTGGTLLYGGAACSWQDRFTRKIGRKVALTRAIKDMPRDFRSQVWAAYLQMQHGTW